MWEEIGLQVDFWGIVIKVCAHNVIELFFRFQNSITLAKNNNFSAQKKLGYWNYSLSSYQKQLKSENPPKTLAPL